MLQKHKEPKKKKSFRPFCHTTSQSLHQPCFIFLVFLHHSLKLGGGTVVKHQVIFQEVEKVYTQVFLGDWVSDKCFIRQEAYCLDDITNSWRIYYVPFKTERFKLKSCKDFKPPYLALHLLHSFTEVNETIHHGKLRRCVNLCSIKHFSWLSPQGLETGIGSYQTPRVKWQLVPLNIGLIEKQH